MMPDNKQWWEKAAQAVKRAVLREIKPQLDKAKLDDMLLKDIANCGIEHSTKKYNVVQIDLVTWDEIQAAARGESV